jgi:DNA polymerase I
MATELFPAASPDVLYLVDLSGYVFRAYHAITTPLSSPTTGEPTHAVLGTVNMLEKLVRERRPALFAVAMDSRTKTFRKEIYPAYKAHRPPPPEDLRQQMTRCQQIVEAFAVPIFQKDGVEADDLIAAAVKQARERGIKVVIVSADKDLMPLVGEDVVLWDTMRYRVFGRPEVEERFGVRVDQIRDWLALTGDSSDNIPGVPHVGPKTATELLTAHGDLDGIYAHLDAIKKKAVRATLEAHRAEAELSRRLVTLKDDVDCRFDPEALAWGGRDVPRLRELYAELGFQKHLAALEAEPAPAAAESRRTETLPAAPPVPVAAEYTVVTRRESLEEIARAAEEAGRLALRIEGTSDAPMRADVIGLSLGTAPGRAWYVPIAHRYVGTPTQLRLDDALAVLGPVLASERVAVLGHDVKYTDVVLQRHGIRMARVGFDSMLAAYLIDATASHDLAALAHSELAMDLPSLEAVTRRKRGQQLGLDEVSVEDALAYGAARADAICRLSETLSARLGETGLLPVFDDLELPLSRQLADLERTGVLVDARGLGTLGQRLESEIAALEQKAHAAAGREFNVHAPRQLETLLFDDLGLRPLKRTKTARSTDAATLEALAEQHPLPAIILEIRQMAKLKGTYIDALPSLVHPETGRIHTCWAQAVAATGRLSSQDPNLQNIPIRSELGRAIRRAFVAPPGQVLLSADYSQIELRVLAHLSGDPVLVDAFRTGQDVHTRTALEIFGVTESELTAEHRRRAKAVNFGIVYGQGDSGLARSLGIPRTEAASFIAAYFRRYQGVRTFMESTLAAARAGESVRTLLGRRRLVPDIGHANRARRLAAERIAMNTPIQGTAADLLKLAMLALRDPVTPGTRMILTVHDELVFEVPEGEAPEAGERIRAAMQQVQPLTVPLVVDIGVGRTWSDAH